MVDSVRVAAIEDIPPGTGKEFTIGDRVLAVFNVDGAFQVFDGICPHAGGPLGQGGLHGSIVTCPWHGWQFDVSTGHHCLNDQIRQTHYNCHVKGGDLLVELPQ